jgi:PAS domain S-box-containing protein
MKAKFMMSQNYVLVNIDELTDKILNTAYENKADYILVMKKRVMLGFIITSNGFNRVDFKKMIRYDFIEVNLEEEVNRLFYSDNSFFLVKNDQGDIVGFIGEKEILGFLKEECRSLSEMYNIEKAIFDNAFDGLYITDEKGFTMGVNKAYLNLTGLNKEDLIGFHMTDLIGKNFFSESASLKVINDKKAVTIMDTFENGRKCLVTSNPVFDLDGNLIRVVSNVRDMSILIELQNKIRESEKLNKKYINEIERLSNAFLDRTTIIGNNKLLIEMMDMIDKISDTDANVLLYGETGTGKELVSQKIHELSNRKNGPFVKINCAAIPENLLESELFGYDRGAFTGAYTNRAGKFEEANSGTILLDEIEEISFNLQSKLLRVIQEKEIVHLGANKTIQTDARVIASTNVNLLELVKKGRFRSDLYHRLNVIPINIPPLRERKDDIELLLQYFVDLYNKKYQKNKSFKKEAIYLLTSYQWPGNVRELKNLVERLVIIVNGDTIEEEHIISSLSYSAEKLYDNSDSVKYDLSEAIEKIERIYLKKAINTFGTTRKAANALGISQPTFVRKYGNYFK